MSIFSALAGYFLKYKHPSCNAILSHESSQNILQKGNEIHIKETKWGSLIIAKLAVFLITATEISGKQPFYSLSIQTFTLLFR